MKQRKWAIGGLALVLVFSVGLDKGAQLKANELLLILNAPGINGRTHQILDDQALPRNWRSTLDPYKKNDLEFKPTREGLESLRASGSAEFSKKQFLKIKETLKGQKLLVVDLRQEAHGFLDGNAISWYGVDDAMNANKTLREIELDERKRLRNLTRVKEVELKKWMKGEETEDSGSKDHWQSIRVIGSRHEVKTEQELMASLGVDYYRVPAPDHQRPRDSDVDRFISRIKKLDKDQWVHFHCAAGRGRTTTFMIIYDMMRNCHKVPEKDLIMRQYVLGGANLESSASAPDSKYEKWAKQRTEFIHQFYNYCKEQKPEDFKVSWSEWTKKSHLKDNVK